MGGEVSVDELNLAREFNILFVKGVAVEAL